MHVIVEGYRCISQLLHSIHRIESSSHSYLHHVGSEGPEVRNHVDVTCPNVGGTLVEAIEGVPDLADLGLHLRNRSLIPLCTTSRKRGLVVGLLFTEAILLSFELPSGDFLFLEAGTLLPVLVLLFCDLGEVVGG